MNVRVVQQWLEECDESNLENLWIMADSCRKKNVGDSVHLRALLKISNMCEKNCVYCGIGRHNRNLIRYSMAHEEIVDAVENAFKLGFATIILQGGQSPSVTAHFLSSVIETIKSRTGMAVTLSLGERNRQDLERWRNAGADRYLLKLETMDPELFRRLHPRLSKSLENRINLLLYMRDIGYEIGTGVIVGLLGQTAGMLARDIVYLGQLQPHMVANGPFVQHPLTPLAKRGVAADIAGQIPNTALTALKVIALSRICCEAANIPVTSALETLSPNDGRVQALKRGANVVMIDVTPQKYRQLYTIYPSGSYRTSLDDRRHAVLLDIKKANRRVKGNWSARKE